MDVQPLKIERVSYHMLPFFTNAMVECGPLFPAPLRSIVGAKLWPVSLPLRIVISEAQKLKSQLVNKERTHEKSYV